MVSVFGLNWKWLFFSLEFFISSICILEIYNGKENREREKKYANT